MAIRTLRTEHKTVLFRHFVNKTAIQNKKTDNTRVIARYTRNPQSNLYPNADPMANCNTHNFYSPKTDSLARLK